MRTGCSSTRCARPLVVEAEALAVVADRRECRRRVDERRAAPPRPPRSALPVRVVGRRGRVLREGVQDVGEHQFLMLLLVMEPDLEDRQDRGQRGVVRVVDQRRNRRVDMRAVGRDFARVRPRDQAALRPRMARAGGDVVGVEQEREALVERPVAGHDAAAAETARRTRSCARDAIWSGSRPASTGSTWSSGDSGAARRSVSSRTA